MTTQPNRARLDKKPHEVQQMFDGVARRYDLTNTVMTGGLDRVWRTATRKALELKAGQRVLDLACGTGVSTAELAKSGAYCVGADFSLGMLRAGAETERVRRAAVPLVAADALHLPFADQSFDAVLISFGLRNVADVPQALREMLRVTKPGGRMAICEFSTPTTTVMRRAYFDVVLKALPHLAASSASNAEAYDYLAESIRAWPDQQRLAELIEDAGWIAPQWRNLTGGVVAIHRATRPRL